MTSKENYEQLRATIDTIQSDFEKFEAKKIKAAGQRVRNHLLNAKKLCDVLRKQIIDETRGLPTKHRIDDTQNITEPGTAPPLEAALPPVETPSRRAFEDLSPQRGSASDKEAAPSLEAALPPVEQSDKEAAPSPVETPPTKPKRTRKANKK